MTLASSSLLRRLPVVAGALLAGLLATSAAGTGTATARTVKVTLKP